MENILEGTYGYLSGPIEKLQDHGIGWRQHFLNVADKVQLPIYWIDPCNKPEDFLGEIGQEQETNFRLRKEEQWDELTQRAKKIRRYDLRACDHSHFCVCYLNTDIFTIGTIDELITCERQQKPLFVIVEGGKAKAPIWLFAIVEHKFMFDSVESCVEYLSKLNNGEQELSSRWVLNWRQHYVR